MTYIDYEYVVNLLLISQCAIKKTLDLRPRNNSCPNKPTVPTLLLYSRTIITARLHILIKTSTEDFASHG